MAQLPQKLSLTTIFRVLGILSVGLGHPLLAQELKPEESPWQYKSLGEQGYARLARINAIEQHLEKLGQAGAKLDAKLEKVTEEKLKKINSTLKEYEKLQLGEIKKEMDKLKGLNIEEKLKGGVVEENAAFKELKEKVERLAEDEVGQLKKEVKNLQFVVQQLQKIVAELGHRQGQTGGAKAGKGVLLPGVGKKQDDKKAKGAGGVTPTPTPQASPTP